MTLPKQVQEQAAQVERMMQNIENAQPYVSANTEHGDMQVDNTADAVSETNEQPSVTPQEATQSWEERALKAEQRYQVLQGKYNKEIQELRNGNSQQEIAILKNQLAQMQQQLDAANARPEPPVSGASLDELREDYGAELVDGLRAAILAEVGGQVNQVQQTMQQDSFATKKALLSQHLASRSINFEQVNSDPLFHDWLGQYDQMTGVQRQEKLNHLFDTGQIEATAALFAEFVGSAPQQNHTPFNQHVQVQSTAPAQTAPNNMNLVAYTPAQIQQFYADWARGKYTAEQAQKIEREIISQNSR